MTASTMSAPALAIAGKPICKGCDNPFQPADLDQASRGVCGACLKPGARPIGKTRPCTLLSGHPRAFTPADKSLIDRVHGYMASSQLLELLNDRMRADIGGDAPPYTPQQLHVAIQSVQTLPPVDSWSNVRKQLAEARRNGVLDHVNDQLIDDFAVVFSLTAKQVLHLKDVLLAGGQR